MDEARPETDPESAVVPAERTGSSGSFHHHSAQKRWLAIAADPTAGDLHQIRVREHPFALRTSHDRICRRLWAHQTLLLEEKIAPKRSATAPPSQGFSYAYGSYLLY